MYEVFEQLLQKFGVSTYQVSKATGIPQSTFSSWKSRKNLISGEKAKKIAEYFGVSVDYLMTGVETKQDNSGLTARDKRDITKDLDSIMEKLTNKEDGPASYDGEDLSPEAAELFKEELEIALKRLKLINKEKYNPNKNKR